MSNVISTSDKNKDTISITEDQQSTILVPVKPVTSELVVKDDYTVYVPLATDNSYGIVKKSDFIKTEGENQKITNSALYGDILTVERDGTDNKTVVNDGSLYLEKNDKALYQTPDFIRLDDGNYNIYDLKFQYKNGTLALIEDIPTKVSELNNDKGFITDYTENDPTVPDWAKQTQKPNYTYSEIKETPTKISHFLNDSGFVTNAVNNLVNYYTKNDITNILSTMSFVSFEVVNELPKVGKSNIIYLVAKKSQDQSDIYDEYVWVENLKTFENLGNTQIDLSDYSTKEWVRNEINKLEAVVFTPNIDKQGNLSWTNNGGLDNPEGINIKGESGVYVGDEEPTDLDIKVWIDTDGIPDNPYMNVGNVVTNSLETSEEGSVIIENRYIPIQDKTVTDFTFNIPRGKDAEVTFEQETGDSETSTMSQAAITDALEMKADAIDLSNLDAKALKTPVEAPTELQIVAIDTNNAQTLIDVPEGAIIYQTTGQNTDGSMSQKAVTDALENRYTKAEVDAKVSSIYKYKGNVNTFYDLSTLSDPVVGDVYNVLDTGSNYAWNGSEWDKLSETVDLSSYLTKTEASSTYAKPSDIPTKTSDLNNDSGFITKSGFSMRASSTPLKFYYNEGDGETAVQLNTPDISKHTLSLVPSGTRIPKDGNLDLNSIDYIKVGLYYCDSDTTTQTLLNRPTKYSFMMEVYSPLLPVTDNETTNKWVYRIRKLMTYTGEQYIQMVSSGDIVGEFTYGAWQRIIKSDELSGLTVGNANKVGGIAPRLSGQDARNKLVVCGSDGVTEVGKYMDFHSTYEEDYAVRVNCPDGVTGVGVNLPSKNGTLAVTSDIPSSADFVKTSGGQEIDGYKKFLQDLQIGPSLTLLNSPNGGIEIGRRDNTTSTPYIDFHTDGNPISSTDYNVRMMASGGTKGKNGDGTLNISAGKLTLNSKELALKEDFLNKVYPVGSIYLSVNNVNPSTFIGGTWELIKDRFLLGAGNSYSGGATGGSATHTLTENEMPSHTHIQNSHGHDGSSTHGNVAGIPAGGNYSTSGVFGTSTVTDSSVNTWGSSNGKRVNIQFAYSPSVNDTTAINQNTGGGQAHNNMPPYLAVYMWKRTA